jgi:hypothetical protein
MYRFQGGCVIGFSRGCNTPRSRWVPSPLEPCALALLQEGPWYGFAPTGYKLMRRLQPGKTGVFSRRQACQGKSQSPVVWMAG